MKKILLFACLLSALFATVHAMDQKRLLENDSRTMESGIRSSEQNECPIILQIKPYPGRVSISTCRSQCCCLWDIECDQVMQEGCAHCCGNTCWCLCGLGTLAGIVTGLVYLLQWEPACDDPNWYNPDCVYNYTLPPSNQSNTLIAKLTQVINKSKTE